MFASRSEDSQPSSRSSAVVAPDVTPLHAVDSIDRPAPTLSSDDLDAMARVLLMIVDNKPDETLLQPSSSFWENRKYHALPRCFLASSESPNERAKSPATSQEHQDSKPSDESTATVGSPKKESNTKSTLTMSLRRAFGSLMFRGGNRVSKKDLGSRRVSPNAHRTPLRDTTNAPMVPDGLLDHLSNEVGESVLKNSPSRVVARKTESEMRTLSTTSTDNTVESTNLLPNQAGRLPPPPWKRTSLAISPLLYPCPSPKGEGPSPSSICDTPFQQSLVPGLPFPNRTPVDIAPIDHVVASAITPLRNPNNGPRTPFAFTMGFVVNDFGEKRWHDMKAASKQRFSDSCSLPSMDREVAEESCFDML